MCGIFGVLGNIPSREKVIDARDSLIHRGPDDSGLYYEPSEGVALGFRRLSIIDLTAGGHQPFISNDGRYVLVYNGEMYNYRQLKEQLRGGYAFRTSSDTEVVVASFAKWGKDCLKHLQGMFAFVVWDRVTRELLIARDRIGIKPMYYSFYHDSLFFASEIKAILRASDMPRRLNRQGLLDYLSYRYVLGHNTFFEGIHSLEPGCFLEVKPDGSHKATRYWDLPILPDKEDPGEQEVLETTEALIRQTVESHMVSDVPVGAYLSGGLDSSALVALMAEMSSKRVKTYSIGFHEPGFRETEYAQTVAQRFNTDHHEIILDPSSYIDTWPEAIRFKDEPLSIPNEVALHVLSKELKKSITVVLSGEGADELFAGYGRIFRSGYDLERMRLLSHQLTFDDDERVTLTRNLELKYNDFANLTNVDHFLNQYSYFAFNEKEQLINADLFPGAVTDTRNRRIFQTFLDKLGALQPSEQYLQIFQKIHLLGPLRRLDSSTMSSSVEARVPYVDHVLVEYINALPLKYKMAWKSETDETESRLLNSDQISEQRDITKYVLRKISANLLPDSIVDRKKLGFPVPLGPWFRGESRGFAQELLLSADSKSRSLYNDSYLTDWLDHRDGNWSPNHGINIWMLLNVELWMREYGVSI